MYGDPEAIRMLARRMSDRAFDLRGDADDVAGRAEAVPWSGSAAEAMRGMVGDHTARLRGCADAHHAAAEALDRHAREVARLQHLIAAIGRRALGVLESL